MKAFEACRDRLFGLRVIYALVSGGATMQAVAAFLAVGSSRWTDIDDLGSLVIATECADIAR